MLSGRLCRAFYWDLNFHRTGWILTKTANQSCSQNSSTCKSKTENQSYRTFSSTRPSHRLLLQQFVTTSSETDSRSRNQAFYKWNHRKYSSSDSCVVPVFKQAAKFKDRIAVVVPKGHYTYADMLHYSADLADELRRISKLKNKLGNDINEQFPLKGETVAFLCGNNMSYVVTLLAIWMCGGIAVPLCTAHPVSELEYFITDSGAKLIISSAKYESHLRPIASQHGLVHKILHRDDYTGDYDERGLDWLARMEDTAGSDEMYRDRKALIVYTSGTTGRPKGAVHTFGTINAHVQSMVQAWGWTSDDVILHVLPLHHVHGITNVLLAPLYCGATCFMMTKFDPKETWLALLDEKADPSVNVFMAVPTIYAKLMEFYDTDRKKTKRLLPDNLRDILQKKIRLMVSGSAALPHPIMRKWEELTGHTLLERYGMTEIGMALTNPLHGDRIPGTVGKPFPGVSVKIAEFQVEKADYVTIATGDSNGTSVTPGREGNSGELLVKGDNVFKEYFNRQKATKESFTHDGWFKTGDTAVFEDGVYKIVGRTSVDIIKSGAYKISALDIERHLLEHPDVRDVAVVGLPDETWGQVIAVVIVPKDDREVDFDSLKSWAQEKMPPYQVPRIFKSLRKMPRNSMGKVNKKDLAASAFPEYLS